MSKRVTVLERSLRITDLEIMRKDVADFFRSIPEDDIETTLISAVELGVFCLQRAHMSQDTEFIRRQVESVLNSLDAAAKQIPAEIQKALLEKIGTKNGQVLAPVEQTVNAASKAMQEKMRGSGSAGQGRRPGKGDKHAWEGIEHSEATARSKTERFRSEDFGRGGKDCYQT